MGYAKNQTRMYKVPGRVYDALHDQFKNYAAECEKLRVILQRYAPKAMTLLDVACGDWKASGVLAVTLPSGRIRPEGRTVEKSSPAVSWNLIPPSGYGRF
jgi:hypothetical protein